MATDDSLPVTTASSPLATMAFAINGSTGAVTLTANPDYETQASYSFTVIATDAAGNASEQAVTLAITDVDEQRPDARICSRKRHVAGADIHRAACNTRTRRIGVSVSGATTAAQTRAAQS